jgi:hypothetical protein
MLKKFVDGALLFACCVAIGYSVKAQTLTVAIAPNTAFTIAFDGNDTDSFRLWCEGNIVKNYTSAELTLGKSATKNADGTYTFTVSAPGLASGMHSCLVSAFNTLGETKSDPIQIPVGNLPMKPINLKVVVK